MTFFRFKYFHRRTAVNWMNRMFSRQSRKWSIIEFWFVAGRNIEVIKNILALATHFKAAAMQCFANQFLFLWNEEQAKVAKTAI